jgi:hypothetical protein
MDSDGHRKPLINGKELSELREGRGFRRVWDRLVRYVRRYRRTLSVQDSEDIVSQAFVEEISSIMNPALGAEDVSIPLARALNRNRARVVRWRFAEIVEVPDLPVIDDPVLMLQIKEVARPLRGYFGQAVDSLALRDRNLIIEQYGLQRFGFRKQGFSPEFPSENARKVAQSRARQRLWTKLNDLLVQAEAAGKNSRLLRDVRALIPRLAQMSPVSQKPPRSKG